MRQCDVAMPASITIYFGYLTTGLMIMVSEIAGEEKLLIGREQSRCRKEPGAFAAQILD